MLKEKCATSGGAAMWLSRERHRWDKWLLLWSNPRLPRVPCCQLMGEWILPSCCAAGYRYSKPFIFRSRQNAIPSASGHCIWSATASGLCPFPNSCCPLQQERLGPAGCPDEKVQRGPGDFCHSWAHISATNPCWLSLVPVCVPKVVTTRVAKSARVSPKQLCMRETSSSPHPSNVTTSTWGSQSLGVVRFYVQVLWPLVTVSGPIRYLAIYI